MCNMRAAPALISALVLALASVAGHAATVSVDVRGADGMPPVGASVSFSHRDPVRHRR